MHEEVLVRVKRHVRFSDNDEILGKADKAVDRTPIEVSKLTPDELRGSIDSLVHVGTAIPYQEGRNDKHCKTGPFCFILALLARRRRLRLHHHHQAAAAAAAPAAVVVTTTTMASSASNEDATTSIIPKTQM